MNKNSKYKMISEDGEELEFESLNKLRIFLKHYKMDVLKIIIEDGIVLQEVFPVELK